MANKSTIGVRSALAKLVGKKMARSRLREDYQRSFNKIYPAIRYDYNWREETRQVPNNESGMIIGSVVAALQKLSGKPKRVLLAGENSAAKPVYSDILSIPATAITIAGLDSSSDIQWNFEQSPPSIETFDVIVSHAIIEHLIDPYKHVCDLFSLLAKGGSAIIYTVMPNFQYHRHPVDCMRFFPDWFMEVAKRQHVTVTDICISEDHIIVTFTK